MVRLALILPDDDVAFRRADDIKQLLLLSRRDLEFVQVVSTILNKLRDKGVLGYNREYVCVRASVRLNAKLSSLRSIWRWRSARSETNSQATAGWCTNSRRNSSIGARHMETAPLALAVSSATVAPLRAGPKKSPAPNAAVVRVAPS